MTTVTVAGLTLALACGMAHADDAVGTGDQIAKVLGLDGKNAYKGKSFKLGIVLALTGAGSYYGGQGNSAKLAVEHINAAGAQGHAGNGRAR